VLAAALRERLAQFPVVVVSGVRQCGKTTLVQHALPDWRYVNLEDLDARRHAQEDPRAFLADCGPHTILDEFQRVPELTSYLQGQVDRTGAPGQYVLTGSQSYLAHAQTGQSLAGRAGLLVLTPFALSELPASASAMTLDDLLFQGTFPPVVTRAVPPEVWFSSYLSIYVERDVRQLIEVRNLTRFQLFLKLLAVRACQLLNLSALAAEAGVTQPTAKSWLSVLEAGHVVTRLQPWHDNVGKRLVKTPKVVFCDTGLLCRLLDLRSPAEVARHGARGSIFENWVVTEIARGFTNRGLQPPLYFWRDQAGAEVDLVIAGAGRLTPIEIKAGATVQPAFFKGLATWARTYSDHGRASVVYGGEQRQTREHVDVVPWREAGLSGVRALAGLDFQE
jgi:predicted AAA+ superfamily ATPase